MSRTQQERIEELARLLDGEVTDRSSTEAQQLLVLANALRDSAPAMERPSPAFRAQLRAQLVREATASQVGVVDRVRDTVRERTRRWRHSAKVATASATASLMIGSAGAAVAAQAALPGELLYPLKQATESVRLALASSSEEVGRLQLDLARERLEEITEGVDTLTASQVIDTLAAMDRHTQLGAQELLAAFDRSQAESLLDELQGFTEEQRSTLTLVLDRLPLEAVPFADRSFELLRRIDVQSAISAAACDCGLDSSGLAGAASAAGRGIAAPGEGPAAPPCDCTEGDTTPPTRDGGLLTDGLDPTTDGLDPTTDGLDGGDTTAGSDDDGDGGISSGVSGPVETLTEPVETLTEPVDELTEPVEDVVDSVTEPVEGLTEDVVDSVTEPVEELTEDVVEELTDTVDEVTDPVEDTVGDLLP